MPHVHKATNTKFSKWLQKLGAGGAARIAGASKNSVRAWWRGYCLPRAEQMHALVHASRGELSYSDIIDPYFKAGGNSRKFAKIFVDSSHNKTK